MEEDIAKLHSMIDANEIKLSKLENKDPDLTDAFYQDILEEFSEMIDKIEDISEQKQTASQRKQSN